MSHLPVIVGMGGINSAGRSSFHHAYRRLVIDALPAEQARQTLTNLAVLMGLIQYQNSSWIDHQGTEVNLEQFLKSNRAQLLNSTLIRKLETNLFDASQLPHHQRATLNEGTDQIIRFSIPTRKLPSHIPSNWTVTASSNDRTSDVVITGRMDVLFNDSHQSAVNTAGQLPTGFDPATLYASRNHPRGLQMSVYGASDAISSMGIDWETVTKKVNPDQIAVYAGSSMSQLDYNGNGGLLQARLLGKRVTSKQLPLSFGEMPADFINAYLLGSLGTTGTNLGACASFHYNLHQGIRGIQSGTHRVAIVGGSEAPILPEVIEAFVNMGALADDAKLKQLDNTQEPNHQRACRPFAENVGFTLAESAQFIVLFDDSLALELGASIYGSVNDVFINADGYKKSIASPGVGNYITMAKATAATKAVLGAKDIKHKTFVQAHGTGTPQNRVTESAIFTDVARQFGIESWPITAVKSYLGHSLACSGADQLASTLGIWKYGIIPGILTTETLADDVSTEHLNFLLKHQEIDPSTMDAAILNSKGFGGNNATASILSPELTKKMLAHKHGKQALTDYQQRNESVEEAAAAYELRTSRESVHPVYKFNNDVKGAEDVSFAGDELRVRGYETGINLDLPNRYLDMCD